MSSNILHVVIHRTDGHENIYGIFTSLELARSARDRIAATPYADLYDMEIIEVKLDELNPRDDGNYYCW